jgi:hypothetical protein
VSPCCLQALNYNKFDREPSVESGRAVTGLLAAQLVLAALSSLAFALAHYTIALSILPGKLTSFKYTSFKSYLLSVNGIVIVVKGE